LLQRQRLNAGGGGGREGAAAAVEEAEGDFGFSESFAFLAALLAACCQPILCCPGVAQLFHWNTSDHHDLLLNLGAAAEWTRACVDHQVHH